MTRRRVGLPPGFNLGGAVRQRAWRVIFHVVGGFKVTGAAPYEAMVVVANHTSHADTPALIAAFPAQYKPVVVAAADYWFANTWKRRGLALAIGAVPIRRVGGGGFDSLLAGAQAVLGEGSSLIVFPEGTRGATGDLGPFHSGAVRIAQEFDVPVLPVAIVGTLRLLPKKGRLRPGPVEVRIGAPVQPGDLDLADMSPLADQIQALLDQGPATATQSRTWDRLHRAMGGWPGMAGACAWGFAEALSFPVTAEMYLGAFGSSHPRRILPAAGWLTAGSVAGVLVNYALTRAGMRPPTPLTTDSMRTVAAGHIAAGARGVWHQGLNGIPIKVYAQAAADAGVPALPLAAHAIGARGARALVFGAVIAASAGAGQPILRRAYGPFLAVAALGYAGGLALVLRKWSTPRSP